MSSRLERPNASVTVMSARTVEWQLDFPAGNTPRFPGRQERSGRSGWKRPPGGAREWRRSVTPPVPALRHSGPPVRSFQPPHRPLLSGDHLQAVARHMAGRLRSPGTFQVAALGVVCALLPLLLPAPAPAQQRPATISGRLIDQDSRAPVGGARIALVGTRFGVTGASVGQFSQGGLAPGIYVVQVHAIGYSTTSLVLRVAPGDAV